MNQVSRRTHSTEQLKERIEHALAGTAMDVDDVAVEVRDDGPQGFKVILKGTVNTFAAKRAIERAAWTAPVTWVLNQLTIRPAVGAGLNM